MAKTTNTTGIGIRGNSLKIGGLSSQPIPFVTSSEKPLKRTVSPIIPSIAPPKVSQALQGGLIPSLGIAASSVIGAPGGASMASAVNLLIPNRVNTVQVRKTGNPALQRIAPELVKQRNPNDETLSLSHLQIINGQFQQANPNGLSALRPEIIGLMDFQPIFFQNSLDMSDVGLLMDFQVQARHLREQTLLNLINGIKKTDKGNQLDIIQTEFSQKFEKVNDAANFFQNTIITLETIKNGFGIKNIPNSNFDLLNFKTLKDFFEFFMLFPQSSFQEFTNTKILMQLAFDLKSICENYSMNLLNVFDSDRTLGGQAVSNPINLDKSYNPRNGFSLTFDTIRSYSSAINAAGSIFYDKFYSALPPSADDRIKVLLVMLSKELRVSRGLGKTRIQNLLRNNFGVTTINGSPFPSLLGEAGNTIFDPILGVNSLSSTFLVNDIGTRAVLPFEIKYIDTNNKQKVYVPGGSFFVDSIISTQFSQNFNTQPISDFVGTYATTIDTISDIIATLFEFGDSTSALSANALLKTMLSGIVSAYRYLNENSFATSDQVVAATFRLSARDSTLRRMLFQFLILFILKNQLQARVLTEALIQDLNNDIRSLSYITVNEGDELPNLHNVDALENYQTKLAATIQDKINSLIQTEQNRGTGTREQIQNQVPGIITVTFDTDTDRLTVSNIAAAFTYNSVLTHAFANFFTGLETILSTEVTNILDTSRRTRYNSCSISTLTLLAFEVFASLINRYTNADFKASQEQGLPNVTIDKDFNNRMKQALQAVIDTTELPLPVLEEVQSISANRTSSTVLASGNRFNQALNSSTNITFQASQVSNINNSASPSSVIDGTIANENILNGRHATAGNGFTTIADLAMRNINGATNPTNLLDSQSIEQSLNSVSNKLFQDDFAIACSLHIFQVIKTRLKNSLDVALNYFTPQLLTNFVNLNATDIQDVSQNLTTAQIKLLIRQKNDYIKELSSNQLGVSFIPTSPTDVDTRSTLLSLLGQSQFRETTNASTRYKLLTVGIPSGFSKNLVERVNNLEITSTTFQKNKQYDVIYINVYKRSLEFPEIIWKPRKYIFDMSLFGNGYRNLNISPIDSWDSALQKITILDYQNFLSPISINLDSIVNTDKYDFLSSMNLKRALFENHILSDLFSFYCQFLTSLKLTEDVFVDQNSETYKKKVLGDVIDPGIRFANLAKNYLIDKRKEDIKTNPSLAPLPDIPIKDMLQSVLVDQATKDILKLLQFGNLIFRTDNALAELLSPKLFDRVFTIPLNIDSFEIDYAKTTSTETGREFLNKDFVQKLLDKTTPDNVYKFKSRTISDAVFEDYFVTIEMVEE